MDLTTILVSTGLTILTGSAATAATLRTLSPRVTELEKFRNDMPKDYVPRNEHVLALANINATTGRIESLLQNLIFHGGNGSLALHAIEASAAAVYPPDDDPDTIEAYIAGACPRFEGVVPHFYLDTRGLVTIGTGNMVPDVEAAIKLPLTAPNGCPADPADIAADFNRVQRMEPGHVASFYHKLGSPLLSTSANQDLLRARCTAFYLQLQGTFKGFADYPAAGRLGMMDMIYNLGPAGLLKFIHLCVAVREGDWEAAAAMCARNVHDPAFCLRNAWTRGQFLLAAKEVSNPT